MEGKCEESKCLRDSEVNWPVTKKLQNDPKFIAFNKWARDNGVLHPKVISYN